MLPNADIVLGDVKKKMFNHLVICTPSEIVNRIIILTQFLVSIQCIAYISSMIIISTFIRKTYFM